MFSKGQAPLVPTAESGVQLAIRALKWGTFYAVGGCGLFFYGVWKMTGANDASIFFNITTIVKYILHYVYCIITKKKHIRSIRISLYSNVIQLKQLCRYSMYVLWHYTSLFSFNFQYLQKVNLVYTEIIFIFFKFYKSYKNIYKNFNAARKIIGNFNQHLLTISFILFIFV